MPRCLIVGCAALLSLASQAVWAAPCLKKLGDYEKYTVQKVNLFTPLHFFAAATFGFDELKARLPLQERKRFSAKALNDGNGLIRDYVKSLGEDVSGKLKFVVVIGQIEDCDDAAQTLNVTYRMFTNEYRPVISRTFEERSSEVERPSTTSAEGGTTERFLLRPNFGYNRSRRGYGGEDFSARLPAAGLKSIELHSSFSSNSIEANGSLDGSWQPHRAALDEASLRASFDYRDDPAGTAKLKEGKFTLHLIAASRPVAGGDAIFRYGTSLEGGHQQSQGLVSLPPGVAPNSSYGAIKYYAGITGRFGKTALTASYGGQAGSTFQGNGVDFVKHIIDLAYSTRFLKVPGAHEIVPPDGKVHKPWDLELRVSAGTIQQFGPVPAAERFFGGNQVLPFVSGGDWAVPGGAYIRSIPENRLGSLNPGTAFGGTHFYSGNVTLAKVVWGTPLVPKELAREKDFSNALNFGLNTAKGTLADYYKTHDPTAAAAYAAAKAELDNISPNLQRVKDIISALPGSATGDPAIAAAVKSTNKAIGSVTRNIGHIQKGGDNTLLTALVNNQFPLLESEVNNLAGLLEEKGFGQQATELATLHDALDASLTKMKNELAKISGDAAQKKADEDFSTAETVLHAFLYELNIYSVAPVAVFDVARVWPTDTPLRYAAGGGVRLSLVNVNFTIGYASNPVRTAREGKGALFLKLDVEDLFH